MSTPKALRWMLPRENVNAQEDPGAGVILLSMDLAGAVSIVTMFGSAVTALKDAKEVAKDVGDIELKEKIGTAYDTLLELKVRLYEVDDEKRRLKRALEDQTKYTDPLPPFGYVYRTDDAEHKNPLCPRCYQNTPQKIGFLKAPHKAPTGVFRHCPVCSTNVPETTPTRPPMTNKKVTPYWE
jgi:hypothetical protein